MSVRYIEMQKNLKLLAPRIVAVFGLSVLFLGYQNCSQFKAEDLNAVATQVSQNSGNSGATPTTQPPAGSLPFVTDTVPPIPSGATVPIKIETGNFSACLLMSDHTLTCWGHNGAYELAMNPLSVLFATTPVKIPGVSNVVDISMGFSSTCVVLSGGSVSCWGTMAAKTWTTPTVMPGVANAVHVSVADNFACALIKDGTVSCWGWNNYGVMGSASATFNASAVKVNGLSQVVKISAAHGHICALKNDRSVWCWGNNTKGELGSSTAATPISTPIQVPGVSANNIDSGDFHSCALQTNGAVKCWGDSSTLQTGLSLSNMSGVVGLGLGTSHSCAWTSGGTGYCWGDNSIGQVGQRVSTFAATGMATPVPAVSNIFSMAAGQEFTCALTKQWKVFCWGIAIYGQLGYGGNDSYVDAPVEVTGF